MRVFVTCKVLLGLWSVGTGVLQSRLYGHSSEVLSVDYSSSGWYFASGDADGVVVVWAADQLSCVHKFFLQSEVCHLDGVMVMVKWP